MKFYELRTINFRRRLGLAILLALLSVGSHPRASASSAKESQQRADAALQSFLLKFWDGGRQYLKRAYPDDGNLTGYWTYAEAWDAVLDGVERTQGRRYSGWIETLYEGQDARGWSAGFYDDENWMCLTLIRAYDLTKDAKYLDEAKALYADIEGGWDETCCGEAKGGIWWDKAHTSKATASNAGPVIAGALLYQRTKDADYLRFAKRAYGFWRDLMMNRETGQIADNVHPSGRITWWKFSYNEGLMIGAGVALNDATGDPAYLADANRIADFMIHHEVKATSYGNVLYDGTNSGCGGDCHEFKGPAYRYLMRLYEKEKDRTDYRDVLKASADALWNLARDPSGDLFAVDWGGPPMTTADAPQQSAACLALSRFAQLSGEDSVKRPAGRYEAEDAALRHVGIEASHKGFTGWGYLAGWNADGQSVEFAVETKTAGRREVTLRYSAGAGDAVRSIRINGVDAVPALKFPATKSWEKYRTASFEYPFKAGKNAIEIRFDSSRGGSNTLNLDNLTIH